MNEAQGFEPKLNDNYAPNLVQQEFLRLVGRRYWYLALGDSNHSIPQIGAFISHTKTVAAVTDGVRKNIFLESPVWRQGYLDSLRMSGRPGKTMPPLSSFWLEPEMNGNLSSIFERAARDNPEARFIAADTRNVLVVLAKSFLPLVGWIGVRMAANILSFPVRTSPDDGGLRLRERLYDLMGGRVLHRLIIRPVADDRKTVRYIKAFDGPAVLEFGTGHLVGGFDDVSARRSMRTLLPEEGKELCVMNVYKNIEHRSEHRQFITKTFPGARLPDADLLVSIAGEDCYGVRLNNPALQPLFNQAVRNVVLKLANPPAPGGGGYIRVGRRPEA